MPPGLRTTQLPIPAGRNPESVRISRSTRSQPSPTPRLESPSGPVANGTAQAAPDPRPHTTSPQLPFAMYWQFGWQRGRKRPQPGPIRHPLRRAFQQGWQRLRPPQSVHTQAGMPTAATPSIRSCFILSRSCAAFSNSNLRAAARICSSSSTMYFAICSGDISNSGGPGSISTVT